MSIPFEAQKRNHPGRARRNNHRVHKGPLPIFISFKAQRHNYLPKGITIVPIANYCFIPFNTRGMTVPDGIAIVANLLNVDPV
jgi:hypothetical protein